MLLQCKINTLFLPGVKNGARATYFEELGQARILLRSWGQNPVIWGVGVNANSVRAYLYKIIDLWMGDLP
jgi:hypothetical protein